MPGNSVFIVAGEASGDLHAANLVKELKIINSTIKFQGMGGKNMQQAGVEIVVNASDLAVVGIVEVIASFRKISQALASIKQKILKDKPDLLILVDYQEFNQKLAAYAKNIGIKVLFYIGPQVWAWRPNRVHKIGKIVDKMAVILPFEVELYKNANIDVEFTGHPLVDEVIRTMTIEQARIKLKLGHNKTVGIFPGSRPGEIKRILPILLKTCTLLKEKSANLQFVLPLADSLDDDNLSSFLNEINKLNIKIFKHSNYAVMQACDVIVTASGTTTLEVALINTPMVIVYKISPLSYFIIKRLINIDWIGLVNIVAGKKIVQEFIQHEAKPNIIADELLKIITNMNYRTGMITELEKIRKKLGGGGGSKNVALIAYEMLDV